MIRAVAVYVRTSTGVNALRYVLEDHQGSVASIHDESGATVVRESFDPFGTRRNPNTWSGAPSSADVTASSQVTNFAYTWQTAIGSMGLIHMNGRVMDSVTGRFISADPYITELGNTQNFNRYGYVYNNPLSFVDPSGFSCGGGIGIEGLVDASGRPLKAESGWDHCGGSPNVPQETPHTPDFGPGGHGGRVERRLRRKGKNLATLR